MEFFKRHKIKLLILVFLLLSHVTYIANGFTWLDHGDIEQKRAVLPIPQIGSAFITRFGETGYYRPLVTIIHSLNYAIYKSWAPGYHLTNIIIHIAVSFMAGIFLSKFFKLTKNEKYLITIIVGIAPITWFTVGTISNIQEPLAIFFIFLTVYLHTKHHILPTLVSFALALLSKETALFWVPALIVFWEFSKLKQVRNINIKLIFREGLIAIIYLLLRFKYVPEIWKTQGVVLPFQEAIATRILALGSLLFKVAVPLSPSPSDATKIVGMQNLFVLISLIFFVILTIVLFRSGFKKNWGKLIVLTAIFILPATNILPLPRFSSTHYGYILTISLAIAVILLLRITKKVGVVIILIWLLLAAYTTFTSGMRHKNDLTLFGPYDNDPNYKEAHFYLANYYFGNNQIEKANEEYQISLETSPNIIAYVDVAAAQINFSEVLINQNKLDEAEALLKNIPNNLSPQTQQIVISNIIVLYTKRAENYYKMGQKVKAVETLRQIEPFLNEDQKQKLEIFMKNIQSGKIKI